MRIAATAVSMDAARTYKEVEQRTIGLNQTRGTLDTSRQLDDFSTRLARSLASWTQTEISAQSVVCRPHDGIDALGESGSNHAAQSEQMLSSLTAQIIGGPVTIRGVQEMASPRGMPTWSDFPMRLRRVELTNSTIHSQEETLLYSAKGSVQTADGRNIAFNLGLSMERSTIATSSISMDSSSLFIDPLILRFDTASPLLSDSAFRFDLDSDGSQEEVACPGSGCGFLAFDRNSDGMINNGLELFGPASGSGFGELAALDSDANMWIDENDPIFDRLQIWSPDGQGGFSLQSLKTAGVGAISVVHAGTEFQLHSPDNNLLGNVKASGIFLTEAGEVRSLQEVDLASPSGAANNSPNGLNGSESPQEATIQGLRDLIAMQQLRLRMMLTGRHLQEMVVKKEEYTESLLQRLQIRHGWQEVRQGSATARGIANPAADLIVSLYPHSLSPERRRAG